MGVAIGLLVITVILFTITKLGIIDNNALQMLANIATIVALIAAIAVFIFPTPASSETVFVPSSSSPTLSKTPQLVARTPSPTNTPSFIIEATNTLPPTKTSTPQPPSATPTLIPLVSNIQIGLDNYNVSVVKISTDGSIYVGTEGQSAGLFKSEDSGNNWRAINNGLGELNIYDIDIVPDNPETVYVASHESTLNYKGHLWMTENGGVSWFPVIGPIPYNSSITEMEADVVAIVSDNGNSMHVGAVVYLSSTVDKGKTWKSENLYDGTFGAKIKELLISPANLSVIYVQTSYKKFEKSVDGGTSWLGVPPVRDHYILDASISTHNSNLIYACTEEGGVYITKDGMGSWQSVNNGIPNQGNGAKCTVALASKISDSRAYVVIESNGLYVSDDYGDTWLRLSAADELETKSKYSSSGININFLTEDDNGDLLIGTTDGVWRLAIDK